MTNPADHLPVPAESDDWFDDDDDVVGFTNGINALIAVTQLKSANANDDAPPPPPPPPPQQFVNPVASFLKPRLLPGTFDR